MSVFAFDFMFKFVFIFVSVRVLKLFVYELLSMALLFILVPCLFFCLSIEPSNARKAGEAVLSHWLLLCLSVCVTVIDIIFINPS